MNQAPLALAFLLSFVGLLTFFTVRTRRGQKPALRRIRAFDTLKGLMGRAVESGRMLHVSLGVGSMANQTSADSLAGLGCPRRLKHERNLYREDCNKWALVWMPQRHKPRRPACNTGKNVQNLL